MVYKVRIPNRDARRGKRGGYRVVYYLQRAEQVALVTVFTKSDKSDVSLVTLRRMIQEYEQRG
jgi:mRNA-degrading endonuclease RelE of RelBE toxin-antitoxin system